MRCTKLEGQGGHGGLGTRQAEGKRARRERWEGTKENEAAGVASQNVGDHHVHRGPESHSKVGGRGTENGGCAGVSSYSRWPQGRRVVERGWPWWQQCGQDSRGAGVEADC